MKKIIRFLIAFSLVVFLGQNFSYAEVDIDKDKIQSLKIEEMLKSFKKNAISKQNVLDYDKIPTYKKDSKEKYNFSGKRIKRGLYKTKNNLLINADINGALNIITKIFSDTFGIRDIGSVNLPHILQDSRLGFKKPNPKSCKEKETPL